MTQLDCSTSTSLRLWARVVTSKHSKASFPPSESSRCLPLFNFSCLWHCKQGPPVFSQGIILLKLSAFPWDVPALCLISKSDSSIKSNHQACGPIKSFADL